MAVVGCIPGFTRDKRFLNPGELVKILRKKVSYVGGEPEICTEKAMIGPCRVVEISWRAYCTEGYVADERYLLENILTGARMDVHWIYNWLKPVRKSKSVRFWDMNPDRHKIIEVTRKKVRGGRRKSKNKYRNT